LIIGAHAPKRRQNGEIPVRNFVKNIFVMTNTKKSEVQIIKFCIPFFNETYPGINNE